MTVGVGVDVVDIARFRVSLQRTPTMRERIFVAEELDYLAPKADPVPSLAARFGAQSIPLLVALSQGREVDRVVGALPRHALEARLASVLGSEGRA